MSRAKLEGKPCDKCHEWQDIKEFKREPASHGGFRYAKRCNACVERYGIKRPGWRHCRKCGGHFPNEDFPIIASGKRSDSCCRCYDPDARRKGRRKVIIWSADGPPATGIAICHDPWLPRIAAKKIVM